MKEQGISLDNHLEAIDFTDEAWCFLTTGFLNGLFSVAKNRHTREVKCIAAGDPYCEWEIG